MTRTDRARLSLKLEPPVDHAENANDFNEGWRRKRDTGEIVSAGRLLPRNIAENININGRMRSCSLVP